MVMLFSLTRLPLALGAVNEPPVNALWISGVGLGLSLLALGGTLASFRSPPLRRRRMVPAVVALSVWSMLVGGAYLVFSALRTQDFWPEEPLSDLVPLGLLLVFLAGLLASASRVLLRDASWGRMLLLTGWIAVGVVGAGFVLLWGLANILTLFSADQLSSGYGLLIGVGVYLLYGLFLFAGGIIGPQVGLVATVGALLSLARQRATQAIVLRGLLVGSLGAALVVALLLARGVDGWHAVFTVRAVLLASAGIGLVLFVVEYRVARHRTASNSPDEATSRS